MILGQPRLGGLIMLRRGSLALLGLATSGAFSGDATKRTDGGTRR